jgi:hypothetical protein
VSVLELSIFFNPAYSSLTARLLPSQIRVAFFLSPRLTAHLAVPLVGEDNDISVTGIGEQSQKST